MGSGNAGIMATPLTEIRQWATSLPAWEQRVLQRLLREEPRLQEDYEELTEALLRRKVLGRNKTMLEVIQRPTIITHRS